MQAQQTELCLLTARQETERCDWLVRRQECAMCAIMTSMQPGRQLQVPAVVSSFS
jgi:hypothetical protein